MLIAPGQCPVRLTTNRNAALASIHGIAVFSAEARLVVERARRRWQAELHQGRERRREERRPQPCIDRL